MTVKLLYRKMAAGYSVYCLLLDWEYQNSLPGKRSVLLIVYQLGRFQQ